MEESLFEKLQKEFNAGNDGENPGNTDNNAENDIISEKCLMSPPQVGQKSSDIEHLMEMFLRKQEEQTKKLEDNILGKLSQYQKDLKSFMKNLKEKARSQKSQ